MGAVGFDDTHYHSSATLDTTSEPQYSTSSTTSSLKSLPRPMAPPKTQTPPQTQKRPTKPASYRPISLTSCLRKIYERILHNRLYRIAEKQNWLSPDQTGFRRKHNLLTPIIRLTQDVLQGFNASADPTELAQKQPNPH
eukprot:TRINITY_DN17080_c0_g1_i1.p1 TRINITY_DN17080_c0_g1~~TRINITY_DN17080_c0_g1_i1.p1  ORF type:complete len:160 (+),score=33.78 TRINITY_DN17080_c0_g1_i1:66-482(+)